MADSGLMNASSDDAIVRGSCVMIKDDRIVYAGPIKGSPPSADRLVLLNPADFENLKAIVDRGRH